VRISTKSKVNTTLINVLIN